MEVKIQYLTPNKFSRPQRPLEDVLGIAVHWVGNPGTSALFNWTFFNSKQNGRTGYGSAHYIVGLEGEIIQAIPEDEMAYHVGDTKYMTSRFGTYPNAHMLGIELCHLDWEGKFSYATMQSATELCAELLRKYDLDVSSLVRHYDITGKDCPRWFVKHLDDWKKFRIIVSGLMCLRDTEGMDGGI